MVESQLEIEFLSGCSRMHIGRYSHRCPAFEGMINMMGESNYFESESGCGDEVGNNDKIKEVCRGHASLRMVKRSSSAIGYSL